MTREGLRVRHGFDEGFEQALVKAGFFGPEILRTVVPMTIAQLPALTARGRQLREQDKLEGMRQKKLQELGLPEEMEVQAQSTVPWSHVMTALGAGGLGLGAGYLLGIPDEDSAEEQTLAQMQEEGYALPNYGDYY
jgi:hypothetical protein